MTQQPPTGFIARGVPKSRREALQSQAHNKARLRTKAALEQYLRSFLDTDGRNRAFVPVVAQEGLHWITDRAVETNPNDPLYRRTQLTRLYNEVRAAAPAILIVDTSFKWIPSGLGSLSHAKVSGGKWTGRYPVCCQVGCTISILTNDQDSSDSLSDLICTFLETLRNLAGGSEIRSQSPHDQWVVRLPLTFEASPARMVDALDDPTARLWAVELELTMDYEDAVTVTTDMIPVRGQDFRDGQVNSRAALPTVPVIVAPSTVRINVPAQFEIRYWRGVHSVHSDRPDIAILNLQTHRIVPRRLGQFRLFVTDTSQPQEGNMLIPTTVAEQVISVTL